LAKQKISRKELLQEPDEFLSLGARVLQYIEANRRRVFILAGALVAAIVLVSLYYSYQEYRRTEGHNLFVSAHNEYRRATDPDKELEREKLSEVLGKLNRLAEDYGGFVSGEQGLLYSGHVLYKLGDYEKALERYSAMTGTSLVENGLGDLVAYHLAMTNLMLKRHAKAKEQFERLANDTGSPYRREAAAAVAGIYEEMGKNKEAIQAYRQYLKVFPRAPDAPFVKARIADLSSDA
jgi:tetratricopeptide (TPR) repeat protein